MFFLSATLPKYVNHSNFQVSLLTPTPASVNGQVLFDGDGHSRLSVPTSAIVLIDLGDYEYDLADVSIVYSANSTAEAPDMRLSSAGDDSISTVANAGFSGLQVLTGIDGIVIPSNATAIRRWRGRVTRERYIKVFMADGSTFDLHEVAVKFVAKCENAWRMHENVATNFNFLSNCKPLCPFSAIALKPHFMDRTFTWRANYSPSSLMNQTTRLQFTTRWQNATRMVG